MKFTLFRLGLAVLVTAASTGAVGLRVGAGAEVIPLNYTDLKDYSTGFGYAFRADIVWGRFSATTVEMGYRRWDFESSLGTARKEFRRWGLIQRFYPLSFTTLKVSPYLGLGITATNRDRFSLYIPDADYAGITFLAGCEIPAGLKRLTVDPYVRWEWNHETDWTYSYVSLGGNLVWKLF
ncbi:MAG: hypothetical protein HY851_10060 [candidate division Zixibacteria bacterium]|nr:hypothetical protein [candidate division Zixibacteria bacterium]